MQSIIFEEDLKLHNNPPESPRILWKISNLPQINKTLKTYWNHLKLYNNHS
jgi:hypothetical protein